MSTTLVRSPRHITASMVVVTDETAGAIGSC